MPPRVEPAAFLQWHKQANPDVILSVHDDIIGWLDQSGVRVPRDAGFLHLDVWDEDMRVSGTYQHPALLAGRAVELVDLLLRNNEHGKADIRQNVVVEGSWNPGTTVRRHRPARPA